ncbi:MAG: restriction endonuclease subunit S [Clostridia bacterium]|nr:restriction endonuclease subunit S [Clostridia bacterium]
MLSLNDRAWKEFTFEQLFIIKRGQSVYKQYMKRGNIPYVSASASNNGITDYVDKPNRATNMISLAYDGSVGFAFYQNTPWFASEKIVSIELKDQPLNRYIAMFLCRAIHSQKDKYNYAYKWSVGIRMMRSKILVPITDDGSPDYAFMEQYIREREDKFIQKYRDFADAELTTLPIPLADKTYKSFKVLDLFDYKRGNQNNMNSLADGSDMLISAKNINNGLKGFYTSTNDKKGTYKGNCITLNNDGDGGVGLAYYQPYKFLLDTHVYALYPKENISSFAMLYLSQALSKQRACFSHGYSISQDRLKAMKIMLPTTDEGSPDYEYMEQYIKAVMFGKYKKYLEYQNCLTP